MKPKALLFSIPVLVIAFAFALSVSAQNPAGTTPPAGTPTPTQAPPRPPIPDIPSTQDEKFPDYLLPHPARKSLPKAALVRPAGIDLDVTYISRTPMYNRYDVWYTYDGKPYLRPGSENDKRWPSPGEQVTFTAHVMNKGTLASGSFSFKWFIDGIEVQSGTQPSLAAGQEQTVSYLWAWAHTLDGERLLGSHTVRFSIDPANVIHETYESNNSLEDRTDAISLVLSLTPELYAALETPVDGVYPFSAEDWLQKQIAAMNAAFARSVYSSTPDGTLERVRADKIVVTASDPGTDWAEDGGFFQSGDDRYGNAYYDPSTDVSGGLIHELSHQLGIIDMYRLDVMLHVPHLLDRWGLPVQMEYWPGSRLSGLMSNPGIRPLIYDELTALAVNSNKGYRRGYYGEYLYDVPDQTYLRVLDNQGNPAAGVAVRLHQRSWGLNPDSGEYDIIDDTAVISGVTDATGRLLLPNRPTGENTPTHTGHLQKDNPFGIISVVGSNDEFIVEITKDTHQEFSWLDITSFNLAAWRGSSGTATMDFPAHVPPDDAPQPPANLGGVLEYGLVKLQWSASPSAGITGYNVYRATGPFYEYQSIATGLTALNYSAPYDYGNSAAQYVVTAVNSQGDESGFSNIFYALRFSNPMSIAVDEDNNRIVLHAYNYYSLLYQLSDGIFIDTLGDGHIEYSTYLMRDWQGRLIISHPGDWYSSRHSVLVTDRYSNPSLEFGDTGSGPGQFQDPAGVAVWGPPCTYGGPYSPDAHTQLLLHFDDSYAGAQGEVGASAGTAFSTGKFGAGVIIDSGDSLTYPTSNNLNRTEGAIEFWLQPAWNGNDGESYTFFEVGNDWFNRMRIMKDGADNLRFMLWDGTAEYGVYFYVGDWKAGDWHHIAVTWTGSTVALFVDGEERASSTANVPDALADIIHIGSSGWVDQQANAVMDELRISDIPRVGNSDSCIYRILVADSGNNRIQAFDAKGNFISAYGTPGSGNGRFSNPQGLAVDGTGNVIVADSGNNRLQVLRFDGTAFSFIRTIFASLNGPTGLAVDGNHIIVADSGNGKVKIISTSGTLEKEYSAPNDGRSGNFNQPHGVTPDQYGNIVVADTGNQRVVTILNALPRSHIFLSLVKR